jgi:hypothetical protein
VVDEEALEVATVVDRESVEDNVDLMLAAHACEKALEKGDEGCAVVLLHGSADELALEREGRLSSRLMPVSPFPLTGPPSAEG